MIVDEFATHLAVIVPEPGGRFEFAHDDSPSDVVVEIAAVRDDVGSVIDLVAWRPDQPRSWWLFQGATLLGEPAVSRAMWRDEHVIKLCETPASWAQRRDGRAACVLDWAIFDPVTEFSGLDRVECETPELAERLVARVRDTMRPSFRVTSPRRSRSAAA